MTDFKIIIYSADQTDFSSSLRQLVTLGVDSADVVWGDSRQFSRIDLMNQWPKCWLFFADHDCEINSKTIQLIQNQITNQESKALVFAGTYLNPPGAHILQRAHNFIANGWVEHSYSSVKLTPLLLGGNFLVFSDKNIPVLTPHFWGAEDKALSYQLRDLGFEFRFAPELQVVHRTSKTGSHFIKRAFLHGVQDIKFVPVNSDAISYLFWIRKIDFANLSLVPLIALHFCIQKMAKLIQKVRPLSKPYK